MRKHIIRTIMISESNAAIFHGKLTEVINDAQSYDLEVDVQYSAAMLPPLQSMNPNHNHALRNQVALSDSIMHTALVLVYDYV